MKKRWAARQLRNNKHNEEKQVSQLQHNKNEYLTLTYSDQNNRSHMVGFFEAFTKASLANIYNISFDLF